MKEGGHVTLCLPDKALVVLKVTDQQRIVDMHDTCTSLMQCLSQADILIAAFQETLVKRMGEHTGTTDEEVGGAELLKACCLSLVNSMRRLCTLLVEISEVMPMCLLTGSYLDPSVCDLRLVTRQIPHDIVHARNLHVTIHEEQPFILALGGKEITGGGTAAVLFPDNISAMRELVDNLVSLNDLFLLRAIVCHQDLIPKR
jgi:hypothetical protein